MALCWRCTALCAALLLGLCALQLCSAQVCNVTEEDNQTIYRVPPVTASHCDFSWSNATGSSHTVLAHHKGGSGDVVGSSNVSTLITLQCFDHIIYKCKCFPEDVYFQVNCSTTCKVKPAPLGMNKLGRGFIGTIVVVALLLLLAVVVGAVVKRKRICKYDPVKTDPESSSCGDQGQG